MIALIIISLILFSIVSYIIIRSKTSKCINNVVEYAKTALIVIAHPDDECMFFSPTIVYLNQINIQVYILCLSNGNYYGSGELREKEFLKSARCLGIPSESCYIINHSQLQDHPSKHWKRDIIIEYILKFTDSKSIDLLITFDKHGVSQHSNHISIYESVNWMYKHEMLSNTSIFYLETVGVLRKYLSICDALFSFKAMSNKDLLILSNVIDFSKGVKAMLCHRSQLVWFRILYIIFSQYMFINRLKTP